MCDRQNINEILLKVALNTIHQPSFFFLLAVAFLSFKLFRLFTPFFDIIKHSFIILCATCSSFHYRVLILYAIFLSFNIEFLLSSAQLAYIVCQCFTFILHTIWRYEDCRWHTHPFPEVTFLGTHNDQTI